MNNKKTLYWAAGLIAALLAILLVWGLNRNGSEEQQNSPSAPSAGQTETSADIHAGMNHGAAQDTSGAGTAPADSGYDRYMDEQTDIMDRMMRDMDSTEETGNSALDFIAGMIPHHEAAVAMAESYLNNGGSHEELKPLAENIITAQKTEITQMEDMRKAISESGKKDQKKADAYRQAYQDMMSGHHGSHDVPDAGSIDAAFAEGMIMHHQMAVDMAKAILDHTDEEDVLALSQQIIDDQEEEISLMQKVLQDS